MLSLSQSIDEFATDYNSSGHPSNFLTNKSNNIGGGRRQHPIQLTLPHFASVQCPKISTARIARRLPKRTLLKESAQQFLPDQHQLSFQFFGSNASVGAEE